MQKCTVFCPFIFPENIMSLADYFEKINFQHSTGWSKKISYNFEAITLLLMYTTMHCCTKLLWNSVVRRLSRRITFEPKTRAETYICFCSYLHRILWFAENANFCGLLPGFCLSNILVHTFLFRCLNVVSKDAIDCSMSILIVAASDDTVHLPTDCTQPNWSGQRSFMVCIEPTLLASLVPWLGLKSPFYASLFSEDRLER